MRIAPPNICARYTAIDDHALRRLRQELSEPLPHPDLTALREFSRLTTDWTLRHFATLSDQPTGRHALRSETEELLREPPPEQGRPFADVLAEFDEKIVPRAVRVNHPRFFAFVPGAPNFVSVLGDWLCAGANFFAGVWLEASGPAQVELVVIDWFKAFLGCPAQAGGVLTSGGSEATLTALVVARDRLAFADRSRAVLYVTEQRHWSVDRAARIIGLAPEQVRPLPVDREQRLMPANLAAAVRRDREAGLLPWVVVANAGATNTGAVDPLPQLADLCEREQLWLHVDAAYGWTVALTSEGRRLLDGIGRADSLTLDPHKWLAQTFEAGCVLIRDGRLLAQTFAQRPEYMQDVEPNEDEVNFADRGIALTRRFRALKIWLSMKVLGVAWFRALVERCCRLAEYAEALIRRTPGFEILSPAQLSIVCFRRVWPGRNQEAQNRGNLTLIDALRNPARLHFLHQARWPGGSALLFRELAHNGGGCRGRGATPGPPRGPGAAHLLSATGLQFQHRGLSVSRQTWHFVPFP